VVCVTKTECVNNALITQSLFSIPNCVLINAGRGFNPIISRSWAKKVGLAAVLGFAPRSFIVRPIPSSLYFVPLVEHILAV
jgi:hypothetical protein